MHPRVSLVVVGMRASASLFVALFCAIFACAFAQSQLTALAFDGETVALVKLNISNPSRVVRQTLLPQVCSVNFSD